MIGGVGFVLGTVNPGALLAPGALTSLIGLHWTGFDNWLPLVAGVGTLVAVRFNQNGITYENVRSLHALGAKLRGGCAACVAHAGGGATAEAATPNAGAAEAAEDRGSDRPLRRRGRRRLDQHRSQAGRGRRPDRPQRRGKDVADGRGLGLHAVQGRVLLDDQRIDDWPAHRRAVAGLVRSFQGLELFPELTVLENLQVPHDRQGGWRRGSSCVRPTKTMLPPVTMAAIADFGLAPILHRSPDEISYGQRRLVAIARAVAAQPSVLLLDEPVAGLTEHESSEFAHLVRRLADTWGMAVLVIEHDMGFVMSICDRITLIDFGKYVCEGTPAEVRTNPAAIAAYLGDDTDASIGAEAPPASGAHHRGGLQMNAAPLLEARGLCSGYAGVEIVRDVTLEVRPGEVVALLGANGAGKTTTLLTLAGELNALGGEVLLKGRRATAPLHKRARNGMALVTEERSVFPKLTTRQNLAVGRADIDNATTLFPELAPLMSRRAGLLSGGEQQMLTLGRALARQPDLLLADELSLGLAPKTVGRLLRAVRVAADGGVGALLVEQHVHRVLEIADRVYLLHQGQIRFTGTATEARASIDEIQAAYLTAAQN